MNSPIKSLDVLRRYKLICTLSFGDVYGQIIVWLLVIFISLATAMGLMGASRPVFALGVVGLILVLSLPFLLFAFVSTLLNHIEICEVQPKPQLQTTAEPLVVSRMQSPVLS